MLVRHRKPFNMGAMLAVSFLGVLALIFSPIFSGHNGLVFSDNMFNKLSKGSSYFIPKIEEKAGKFNGRTIDTRIKLDRPQEVPNGVKILITSGAQVGAEDVQLAVSSDLGKLMAAVLKDSDAMYRNNGAEISDRYGMPEKEVMKLWWGILTKMHKELQKQRKIEESNIVSDVIKKGIEPAYNFYGIDAESVASKAFTMIFLLVFYVAYTLWWGYAIFYLFDGVGLSMKKAKVKKEV